MEYCKECLVCKIANQGDETGNLTPHKSDEDDDPIPVKTLEAQENMTEGEESDWTTPYFRYLTHATYRTPWVTCLPKEERELITYRSQFFILKEGELHRIFHNKTIKKMYAWKVCEELHQDPQYTRKSEFFDKCHQTISSTRTLLVAYYSQRYFNTHHTMHGLQRTGREVINSGKLFKTY